MHTIYLILGSNIDPVENTRRAIRLLSERVQVLAMSTCWETPPVGTDGPNFINAAVCIQTDFEPEELKTKVLRAIELELGRVRSADKFAPRPIDLDIVIWDGQVIESQLWTLAYLALPFSELLPELLHPVSQKHLAEVAAELHLAGNARPLPGILERSG
jgi:2-amino-4-hydroxy-6-hydroxymethyldihydropteridine diphosphokinase